MKPSKAFDAQWVKLKAKRITIELWNFIHKYCLQLPFESLTTLLILKAKYPLLKYKVKLQICHRICN